MRDTISNYRLSLGLAIMVLGAASVNIGPADALPPPGVAATFYEHSGLGGWSLSVVTPGCDSGGVVDLAGAYDNNISSVAFGTDGLTCVITIYDGLGGTGASVTCVPGACTDMNAWLFNDRTSSYQVVPSAATTTIVVRDDDGTMEANLDFDFTDDTAYKDLVLSSGDLASAVLARLWIYAAGQNCGFATGTQDLFVNGGYVVTYDPCALWVGPGFVWASIPVPVSSLLAGATNRFQVYDSGATWLDHGSDFGIDTSNDYGRSVARRNYGADVAGELMWYLEITRF